MNILNTFAKTSKRNGNPRKTGMKKDNTKVALAPKKVKKSNATTVVRRTTLQKYVLRKGKLKKKPRFMPNWRLT